MQKIILFIPHNAMKYIYLKKTNIFFQALPVPVLYVLKPTSGDTERA